MQRFSYFHLGLGMGLLALAVYLILWYAAAPVPAGLYPARMGGTVATTERRPEVELPIIWVRPHPLAGQPPELAWAALVGAGGEEAPRQARPEIRWEHQDRPVWARPRMLRGRLRLSFPEEGLVASGVRWAVTGGPERHYQFGEVRLMWFWEPTPPPLEAGGCVWQSAYPHDEPGLPGGDEPVGYYIFLNGRGRLVDLISSMPGSGSSLQGARFFRGEMAFGLKRRFYEDEGWQPLTLPLEVDGPAAVYIPLTPEGRERLRDTYFYCRAIVARETEAGHQWVPGNSWMAGFLYDRRQWREWLPYYVYQAEAPPAAGAPPGE